MDSSRLHAGRAQRPAVTDSREFDQREPKRLEDELASPRFVPTDEAAVRQAECDKRGPHCRQRELDDREAARK
jgi:hypothetical protein